MDVYKEWAHELLDYELSVIPLNGKRPIVGEWSKYCDTLPTEQKVSEWISEFPRSNIGLCMGEASGLVALDVDIENDEKLVNLIKDIFPASMACKKSHKGWTWFYKWTGQRKSVITFQGFGIIDVLGSGSQCMLPPSFHEKLNGPCTWDGPPLHQCLDELEEFNDDWVIRMQEVLNSLGKGIKPHSGPSGRNNALKGLVSAMLSRGESVEKVVQEVIYQDKKWFNKKGLFADKSEFGGKANPELNAFNFVTNIAKSVATFRISEGKSAFAKKDEPDMSAYPNKDTGFYKVTEKGDQPQYNELKDYVINTMNFTSTDMSNYIYRNNYYKVISPIGVDLLIRDLTNKKALGYSLNNFRKALITDAYKEEDELVYDERLEGLLNVGNGMLDIKSKKLRKHDPDYFFTYKLDHSYDPHADCPKWKAYLENIFEDNPELVDISAEIFGYCILGGDPFIHKAFVLLGTGGNGKSTWLSVLQELIGKRNFSSVSMKLIDKPFSAVQIQNKLCNITDESPKSIIDSEAFKAITGGGYITAAFKGRDEFTFKPNCRLLFSANHMPKFNDSSAGMLRRFYFIPFNKSFLGRKAKKGIHLEFMDELPGILNWALEGLERLLSRPGQDLPEIDAQRDLMSEYRQQDDTIYYWVRNYIFPDDENKAGYKPAYLYNSYKLDMESDGRKAKSKMAFYKDFSTIIENEFSDCKFKTKSGPMYRNIKYKPDSAIP